MKTTRRLLATVDAAFVEEMRRRMVICAPQRFGGRVCENTCMPEDDSADSGGRAAGRCERDWGPDLAEGTPVSRLARRFGERVRGGRRDMPRELLNEIAGAAGKLRTAGADKLRTAGAAAAGGAATAAGALADKAVNLDFSAIDPTKYLYAGTRGHARSLAEAERVWEAVPEAVRMRGPEATADYLGGKDWSHIVARSRGGGDEAANGLWEASGLNRARGAETMTGAEIEAAAAAAKSEALRAGLLQVGGAMLTGAAAGAAAGAVLGVIEDGLAFQKGEIDERGMWARIGKRTAGGALAGAVVTGLLAAVGVLCPPLLGVLSVVSLPAAVLAAAVVAPRLWTGIVEWTQLERLRPLAAFQAAADAARAGAAAVGTAAGAAGEGIAAGAAAAGDLALTAGRRIGEASSPAAEWAADAATGGAAALAAARRALAVPRG